MLFPLNRPNISDALQSFEDLKKFNGLSILEDGEWNTRSLLPEELKSDKFIGMGNVGNKFSNYYHWSYRMACDSLNSPSPLRSWYNPKIRRSVESCKFYDENPATALALRKYIASQFRPSAAKCIYEMFNAKKIYDPCGGWGDRLSAAMSLDDLELYYTRDVNTLVFAGYTEQLMNLPEDELSKYALEHKGSEEDSPSEDNFDLVFTSPPYYKIEKYNGHDQSFRHYKKFDDWLNGFLFKMCHNSWDALKTGGHMAINISDVYANHTYNRICEPLIEYCQNNLNGCTCEQIIGYRMTKRVGSKSDISGVFAEPIIIFKKS